MKLKRNGEQQTLAIKKLLLIMRITAFLVLIATLQVNAGTFGQQLNLDFKKKSVESILKEIEKQTGYTFWHRSELINKKATTSIQAKNSTLQQVLDVLCSDQHLSYSIVDKIIVLKKKEKLTNDDNIVDADVVIIKKKYGGVIISSDTKKPLQGATITIKNKKEISKVSDANGVFSLDAEVGDILQVSFIGFQTRELVLPSDVGLLTIELTPLIEELEATTVTSGYQTISKERTSGSYSKANKDIISDRSVSMNILDRLDGLIPGLTVNRAPNATANPFLIRGLTSINSNRAPLVVVDGIPGIDINTINPQDVDDITVLRDAVAASVWGSRAANGVIVITTKKGVVSDKMKVRYDAFVSVQGTPNLDYLPGLNSQQFIQAAREVFDPVNYPYANAFGYVNLGSTGVPPHERFQYFHALGRITTNQLNKSLDSLGSIDNRQQVRDLWFRNAVLQNHTLSLSGGNKAYSFYGSLAYTNNQSFRPGETNQQFKVNFRQDLTVNKWMSAFLITDLTNSIQSAKNPIDVSNRFYPYQLFRDEQGNNISMPYMQYLSDSLKDSWESRSRISLDYNPLDEFNRRDVNSRSFTTRLTGGLKVKLTQDLRFEGTYAYVSGNTQSSDFLENNHYLNRAEIVQFTVAASPTVAPRYWLPTTGGRMTINDGISRSYTIRNQLIFDKKIGNKHQINLLAGQEALEQLTNSNSNIIRGFDRQMLTVPIINYDTILRTGVAGVIFPNGSGGRSSLSASGQNFYSEEENIIRNTSYYGAGGYTYNNKYAFNGSVRIDQSNLFGLDKAAQNRPVWSIGAKWHIGRESFISKVKWVNALALRATYGITGNAPNPGIAASQDIMRALASANFPGGQGLVIATPANRRLSWERTETINVGLDFSILNSRIGGSIDVYRKNTTDLIGVLPLNPFTGYASITGNFGDLINNGVEVSLNTINFQKRDFTWRTSLNLAYNKNRITDIRATSPIATGLQQELAQFVQSYPAFSVFAYRFAGLDALGDPTIMLADKSITKLPNAALAGDLAFMGTFQPIWSGGFTNALTYKDFTLTANATFNMGHVIRRPVNTFFSGRLAHNGPASWNVVPLQEFNSRWKQPGDEQFTNVPSYVSNNALHQSRRNTRYYTSGDLNVINASYIKLRDITLSYKVPQELLKRINTQSLTLRLQVNNVMLWRANKFGIDPEFIGNLPFNQNSFTFGANIQL